MRAVVPALFRAWGVQLDLRARRGTLRMHGSDRGAAPAPARQPGTCTDRCSGPGSSPSSWILSAGALPATTRPPQVQPASMPTFRAAEGLGATRFSGAPPLRRRCDPPVMASHSLDWKSAGPGLADSRRLRSASRTHFCILFLEREGFEAILLSGFVSARGVGHIGTSRSLL